MSSKIENKLVEYLNEVSYTNDLILVKKNLLTIFKKEEIESFNLPNSLSEFQKSLNDLITKIKGTDFVEIDNSMLSYRRKVRLLMHIEHFESGQVSDLKNQIEMYCYFSSELRNNEKRIKYQNKTNQNEQKN
jgi:hypothetical protein